MTLWFRDIERRDRFIALCKSQDARGVIVPDGPGRWKVNVDVAGSAKKKLTAAWADMTIEYVGENPRQKKFDFSKTWK